MSSTSDIFTTGYRGGQGEEFHDSPASGDRSAQYLTKIIVFHNSCCVHGLKLFYSWGKGQPIMHGTEGGGGTTLSEITFDSGEFITQIEGHSNADLIQQLTFVTTKRRCGPFGMAHSESFEWRGSALGMRFLAFSGRVDGFIRGLQATFCNLPTMNHLRTVQYEKVVLPGPTSNETSTNLGSIFTGHLMSPITTLYVGQQRVEFHVHQDTLTKLPFFQAALQGQFKEALENSISMPDDDPIKISAMIEFLYMGHYTYAYDPTSVQPHEGSDGPIVNLAEGLYHLGVYVVASKYDCQKLSELAFANFKSVANELDPISTLRLWKAAYAEDLQLPRSSVEFAENCRKEGLVSWVTGLFEQHCEELQQTIFACPQLACDLLRIATVGK